MGAVGLTLNAVSICCCIYNILLVYICIYYKVFETLNKNEVLYLVQAVWVPSGDVKVQSSRKHQFSSWLKKVVVVVYHFYESILKNLKKALQLEKPKA